jgi:hypothetical protein
MTHLVNFVAEQRFKLTGGGKKEFFTMKQKISHIKSKF